MSFRIITLLTICLFCSCAPARFVKPLEKKQHAANISLGGPLVKKGMGMVAVPYLISAPPNETLAACCFFANGFTKRVGAQEKRRQIINNVMIRKRMVF